MSAQWKKILVQLSTSQEYDVAKQEWELVKSEHRDEYEDGPPCACGKKIKHAHYYINTSTGKTLCAGTHCSGKFTTEVKRQVNGLYARVLQRYVEKGLFVKITEPQYSESVKEALLQLIRSELYENIDTVRQLRREVSDIIIRYRHVDYLDSILKEIDDRLRVLNEQREEMQRQEKLKRLEETERRVQFQKELAARETGVRTMFVPRLIVSETREQINKTKMKITRHAEGGDQPSITYLYT